MGGHPCKWLCFLENCPSLSTFNNRTVIRRGRCGQGVLFISTRHCIKFGEPIKLRSNFFEEPEISRILQGCLPDFSIFRLQELQEDAENVKMVNGRGNAEGVVSLCLFGRRNPRRSSCRLENVTSSRPQNPIISTIFTPRSATSTSIPPTSPPLLTSPVA